jgi:hypothetical protein
MEEKKTQRYLRANDTIGSSTASGCKYSPVQKMKDFCELLQNIFYESYSIIKLLASLRGRKFADFLSWLWYTVQITLLLFIPQT